MFKQSAIALFVSSLALFLSGFSAYFTLFRQTEILDEAVVTAPDLAVENKIFFFQGPIKVALVNRGTRAAAIVNIDLLLEQRNKDEEACINFSHSAVLALKHEPVVVPVSGITMIEETLNHAQLKSNTGDFDWKIQPLRFDACIRLEAVGLADYTGMEVTDAAFFASYQFDSKSAPPGSIPKDAVLLEFRGSTKRLINHTLTIFD